MTRRMIIAGIVVSALVPPSAMGPFLLDARAWDAERSKAALAARETLDAAVLSLSTKTEERLRQADETAEANLDGEDRGTGEVLEMSLSYSSFSIPARARSR